MTANIRIPMRRSLPYAFTEQGVAMLSSVLRSERAVQVNVEIIRVFVRLRRIPASHEEPTRRMEALEKESREHRKKTDERFQAIFEAIQQLIEEPEPGKRKIGFRQRSKTTKAGGSAAMMAWRVLTAVR